MEAPKYTRIVFEESSIVQQFVGHARDSAHSLCHGIKFHVSERAVDHMIEFELVKKIYQPLPGCVYMSISKNVGLRVKIHKSNLVHQNQSRLRH